MNAVLKYASLVKFAHTVFAMPFAMVGFVYGLRYAPLHNPCLLYTSPSPRDA